MTVRTCEFEIPGVPVGKGRPKFARRGAFVTTYTPEKTASYENLVKLAGARAMGDAAPADGPVDLRLDLFVPVPASWSKRKRSEALAGAIRPTSKPDIDNVVKGICDALNDVVWRDDKQITDLIVTKRYSETPRAEVYAAWGAA